MENARAHFEFHTQELLFPEELIDPEGASQKLEALIRSYGRSPGEVNIIFCSDEALQRIHKNHLDQDHYTDIVTFDYVEEERIDGDLFISVERIRENAADHQRPPQEELHRVMAHGILHLLGHKDKSEKEQERMRAAEDRTLKEWGFKPTL